jgi:hypothetical protein
MAAAVLMEVKESNKKAHDDDVKKRPDNVGVARQNWKKLFAVWKFLSLAQYQSKSEPAELLVANQFVVGKKIANGAFGQLRVGRHNESGQRVAIKLESVNARIPMLFLEHRFYKVFSGLFHGKIVFHLNMYTFFLRHRLPSSCEMELPFVKYIEI